jgi:CheY-like chemotaxis protein
LKILAVDDDPFILELLPLIAAKAGFPEVTTAHSGIRALEVLAEARSEFDCLILDINMPEMDGIELCSRVRKIEGYRRTPIIMLTAMSERDFMDKAFKAGATDYATKPFDVNDLGARLRVARELVQARQEVRTAQELRTQRGPFEVRQNAFDLTEAQVLDGVSWIIDFDSLKNYLMQCSRSGLGAMQVISVKIDGVAELFNRSSTEEFTYALREVADAINVGLLTKGSLISYAGDGVFVAVATSATRMVGTEIEADIQDVLDEKNSEFDNGMPMDLEVSVGNPIQPELSEISDVPTSIERAIARAASRALVKQDTPREVAIRRIGG